MQYLRQSTASQSVVIGPFVSEEDGVTPETGLTISNTDIRLSKNGANIVGKSSGGATHDEIGYYTITLDATDTSTVGRLQLMVNESGALPVYHEFMVLEEAVYDAFFASGADGKPAAFNDLSQANVRSAVGLASANLDTQLSTIDSEVGVIDGVVDGIASAVAGLNDLSQAEAQSAAAAALTAYDPPTKAEMDAGFNGLNDVSTSDVQSAAGAALATYDAATGSDIAGLNDLSAADVRGAVGLASANLDTQLSGLLAILESLDDRTQMIGGLAQGAGGGDNTLQLASGAVGTDDRLNGWSIVTVSGSGAGQSRYITDSVGSTDTITVDGDWDVAVDSTTRYIAFGN